MINNICFKTKLGWINASEAEGLIVNIKFGKIKNKGYSIILSNLKKQIQNYILGKNIEWNFKLYIVGTTLQKKIWKELCQIAYGEIKTYGYIANKIKTSPRYVGNVCGQNKHLLLIPCHRVIRSDGKLGGFSGLGGIQLKRDLIKLESSKNL